MRGLSAALLLLPGLVSAEVRPAGQKRPEIRLCAVGDIQFGRYLRAGDARSYSPIGRGNPLLGAAALLRGADVAFANLETPILPGPPRRWGRGAYVFRADPEAARALRVAGFHVLSLANNHSSNLGLAGAAETRQRLLEEGLRPVGAGADAQEALQPALIDARGLRLAVLAFTVWNGDHAPEDRGGALAYVREEGLLETVLPLIQAAREDRGADWVAVSLHWGIEGAARPAPAQRALARALVEGGADLVLGHHPHVLQEVERYRGGVIAYSLGNFLFDGRALASRQTVVLQATLSGAGPGRRIRELGLAPVLIGSDGVPRPAAGADGRALSARLRELAPGLTLSPPAPVARAGAPEWVEPEW